MSAAKNEATEPAPTEPEPPEVAESPVDEKPKSRSKAASKDRIEVFDVEHDGDTYRVTRNIDSGDQTVEKQ